MLLSVVLADPDQREVHLEIFAYYKKHLLITHL